MFGKLLGFSYMYENKTFFIFFCFERGNSFLKKIDFFNFFLKFRNVLEKNRIF